MTTIAALVPMRHHSQRVPGKNFRQLAGRPLYEHILRKLESVPEIVSIAVDTDSPVVMEGLREDFPSVQIIVRPQNLRSDDTPMNEVLEHDTARVEADLYLQTHTTNPLLQPETISRAIRTFLEARSSYDSLFSVTRLQTRLYDPNGKALNHNPGELIQTQDLPPVYEENSCLYVFGREQLLRRRHRIGERPLMFEIAAEEAWDIDTELDFEICEFLLRRTRHPGAPRS